ncbi:MAG: nucleotidyl transferase AbiEii/AbiGii toxin family protein [Akkermansiaceae bacterium]
MLRKDCIPENLAGLLEIVPSLECLSRFYLAGGTSLALRYGHRFSVDLDFFTDKPFETNHILTELSELQPELIGQDSNTLTLLIKGVKLDVLSHRYPLLRHPETIDSITLASVPDVCAMKVNAVTRRGTKKDFFDLSCLMNIHSLREMIDFYLRKYPNVDTFTAVRSLGYFDDAEEDPDPLKAVENWENVKSKISEALRNL